MIARGTRRGRSCAAMLTAVSLLCAPQTVLAQGDAPYWMSAYQGTFVADACGDAALGHAWRRAYRALVAECPFSNAFRSEFLKDAEVAEDRFHAGGVTADHFLDSRHTCGDVLSGPSSADMRRRLAAFSQGKLSASDALGVNCDGSDKPSGR